VTRWAALIASGLALGCSDLTEGANAVVALEITQPAQTEVEVGLTLQLTARALNKDGDPVTTAPIGWRTADTTVTVSDQGLVTGVAPGAGRVQAFVGSLSSALVSLTVIDTVPPPPPPAPGIVGSQ
jgi:uncharacterized protein YjdB